MKERLIAIKDIKVREEYYPRQSVSFPTIVKFADAMRTGANFPPIIVTKFENEIVLVDGLHRMKAKVLDKEKYIKAEFIKVNSWIDILTEATKRNIAHGQSLSMYDRMNIYQKLKIEGWKIEKISALLQIPKASMIKYAERRITMTTAGEEVVLKSPMQHLSTESTSITHDEQKQFNVQSQLQLINQLIQLIKLRIVNRKNKKVAKALKELRKIL
jgi:hypothetical protein